jgi:hypothetical protein
MKVVLRKEKKPLLRKPPKQIYKIMSTKLLGIEVGHIYPVNKSYFRKSTHLEIKQYLKQIYSGEFILFDETPKEYILKRVKNEAETSKEKMPHRGGRFYIPKRKARNGKMAGNGDS